MSSRRMPIAEPRSTASLHGLCQPSPVPMALRPGVLRPIALVSWLAVGVLIPACGPAGGAPYDGARHPVDGVPESQCPASIGLQDVQQYDGGLGVPKSFVNRHRLAVGQLRWRDDLVDRYDHPGNVNGLRWCSGHLVARNLFLTAGHCVDNQDSSDWTLPRRNGTAPPEPIPREQLAQEFVVELRYEKSIATGQAMAREAVGVTGLLEYRNGGLDYALLQLDGNIGDRYAVARLSPVDTAPNHTIVILQHPMGYPMKVGVGSVRAMQGSFLYYDDLDTLPGSSGAGILELTTGKLVGIHTNGGCGIPQGTANFGISIRALVDASPTLRELVDRSESMLIGDWDGDGRSNVAVRRGEHVLMDTNFDTEPDLRQAFGGGEPVDEYLVGDWDADGRSNLAIRRGACVYMDTNFDDTFEREQCFGDGNAEDEYLVGDWDGDGRSNLGVRRNNHVFLDTNFDSTYDLSYWIGGGMDEDEYLVGDWDGVGGDDLAYRRGNTIFMDTNGDGTPDLSQTYGDGGNEFQYLTGDWNSAHRSGVAVREGTSVYMNYKRDGAWDYMQTYGGQ